MASCKDCVHADMCKYKDLPAPLSDSYIRESECIENRCGDFKDRSRFVELPCKVGDTVYLLHNVYNNILAYSVSKILINSGEPIIEIVEAERRIHFLHLPARELNKSLFFTKEQAEQALKERDRE